MNKKQRQEVFDKCNGRCAFCGEMLESGWHIWDIIPIQLAVTNNGIIKINTGTGNMLPACKECGSVRIKNKSGKMDIEQFRVEIISMYNFARNDAMYSSSIRRAIRYGIIKETNKPIIFYFETLTQKP